MPDTPSRRRLSRRSFLKVTFGSALVTTAAGVLSANHALHIEPSTVTVTDLPLTLPRLHPAFDGYRLVQFSDIHMGTWMTRAHLETIVDQVNGLNPDLIAITGDFVTVEPLDVWANELIPPLQRLQATDGAVAILGNHDHWTHADTVRTIIRDSGLIDVNNAVYTLERDRTLLHIAGVDDYWVQAADMTRVLAQLPDEGAAVLLAHEPDYADVSAATGRFDLQISGHSHGGQVVLPFIGPPVLPNFAHKYPLGLYRVQNMLQYTNRGVGMIAPYVRWNCSPEITVYTLRSGQM